MLNASKQNIHIRVRKVSFISSVYNKTRNLQLSLVSLGMVGEISDSPTPFIVHLSYSYSFGPDTGKDIPYLDGYFAPEKEIFGTYFVTY
jgi:hypothetical protein